MTILKSRFPGGYSAPAVEIKPPLDEVSHVGRLKNFTNTFEMILDQILRLSTKPSWNWHLYQSFLNGVSIVKSFLRYWWTQVRLQESHSQTWSGTQEDSDEQECHRGDGDEPGRHAGDHDYHFQHPHILFCFMLLYFYLMSYVCICNEPGPHIGDRDHRFQHWSFWPSSYIAGFGLSFAYTLCSAGCFSLRG